jgi:hypothetical protein
MNIPGKEYKVTYKTFYNERLNKSLFHTKLLHPLYIQVTFDRIPIYFKSYYYDLFSKPRYAIRAGGHVSEPDIKEIIKMENALVEYIIDKNKESFSLGLFKKEYSIYSKDLADNMEEGFINYLFTFLYDKGMPSLAGAIKEGCMSRLVYDVVRDMKNALDQKLYDELIENSFYYAPPYLPVYWFMQQLKKTSMHCLTVLEWQDKNMKEDFTNYVNKNFKAKDGIKVAAEVDKWVAALKKRE